MPVRNNPQEKTNGNEAMAETKEAAVSGTRSTRVKKTTTKGTQIETTEDSSGSIMLHDINGKEVEIKVTVDTKAITDKLTELLREKVKDFKDVMNRTFENHVQAIKDCGGEKYDSNEVIIFEAGNSSKNKILQTEMKQAFSENKILLVDETDNEFMQNATRPKKIALTPKTAVAFGQVILSDYYVDDSYIRQGTGDAPFNWYVGNINRGDNSFSMIIDKANVTNEWKKYGRINSEDMKIYYADTPVSDGSDGKLREADIDFLDEEDLHKILYVRVSGSNSLECFACEKNEKPGEKAAGNVILK